MALESDRIFREGPTLPARPLGGPLAPPSAPPPVPPPVQAVPPIAAREPLLLADEPDAGDLLGAAEAVRPLAELCLSPEAQTPFLVGIVGPAGSGKSFALRRLAATIEALSAAAGKAKSTPLLSRVVVAPLDAAGVSGDPASALASAAFVALEREQGGASYAALADEAAHATADPRRAAAAATERHDEIIRRLDSERLARDDVEAKRARLAELLLYETPGSRVDSFIRTSRPAIESRLRRFGLAEGDAAANYRDLVRDLSSLGATSRFGLLPRAIWGFRGQGRLLFLAALAFIAAFAVDRLRSPSADAALRGLSDSLAPVADWLDAHSDGLERAIEALIVLGLVALFINVWRAIGFSTMLYRGLRLLKIDIRDRRRELDATAARLERRVVTLGAEAEAASQRAEALAKRAGGGQNLSRAPGPVFLKALETPTKAAREFFVELSRLMTAPGATAPRRLIFVIDNLEALPPTEATRLIETTSALLGPGCAALIACDPARTVGETGARNWRGHLFQVVLDAGALTHGGGERLAARLLSGASRGPSPSEADASVSAVAEPLAASETALLTALAALTDGTPRALKRFHNAYRLARVAKAPRAVVALCLAALQSPNPSLAASLREALLADGHAFEDPAGPPDLVAAARTARASEGKPISKADALAAWDAARRYAPMD
jgi:hypothetical protein